MYLTATLLLIAAPLAAWYAPAIYRIATNQGLLVIETDDDAVEVTVKQNGKLVKLVDRKTGREVNLTAGRYELVLSKGKEGLRLSTTQFTLERGGEEIVKVWREPAARVAIAPALPSGSPGPLVTAPSSPSAAPASPAKPFVILALGGRTEAQFGKLAEAIGAADSGDTIEIRGNGPFIVEPIEILDPLTIRAGAGFQPVLQPASATPTHLLQVRARGQGVVLEGLEFRRDPQGPTPPYSLIDCHHAKLRMAHCRVQNRSASVANSFGDCELRNCEIRSTLGCSCSQDGGKLIIDRCLVTAAGSSSALSVTDWLGYGDSPQRTTITITQSTLVGTSAIFFGTKGFPGFAPAEKQELRKMPLVSLAASDSLFVADSPVLVYLFDNHRNRAAMMAIEIADVAEANDIVRKLLSWRDSNSLYATPGALLGYSLPGIPGIRHQPLADVSTVGQWEQFWGTADTHSAKQDVKFVGWEAGSKWPPSKTLTSEDFRLHQGSPGKHAGPGGSDLGVDIDQLGPGPPYERWKKTPAYQQWLKAAGQTP